MKRVMIAIKIFEWCLIWNITVGTNFVGFSGNALWEAVGGLADFSKKAHGFK